MSRCPECFSQHPWIRYFVVKRKVKNDVGTIVTSKLCDHEFHNPA